MGKRLSKIVTKTGDQGLTGLGDGSRVSKTHPRVEAYGTIDELSSWLGFLRSQNNIPKGIAKILPIIQNDLFDLSAELCTPGYKKVNERYVTNIEENLDILNTDLPYLEEFILPAGGQSASSCHIARTICRRAERLVVTLSETDIINPIILQYLNRLSDWLFIAARCIAIAGGHKEVFWQPELHQKTEVED